MPDPERIVAVAMSSDGHVRVTRGPGFRALGGTEEHHAKAAEIAERYAEEVGSSPVHPARAAEILGRAAERVLGRRR